MILKDTGKGFTPAPAGLQQAVCVDVVDLGLVDTEWGKKPKVELRWQSENRMESGERFLVTSRYTASLNEKATLRAHLESWRGRAFTAEELGYFDTDHLIGVNCQLQVVHVAGTKKPGTVFARVQAIVPLAKGMRRMEPEDYVPVRDRVSQEQAPERVLGDEAEPEDPPF